MTDKLVIKVTCAIDDSERSHLAFNVAATALASGVEVDIVLAADGVHLARPEVARQIQVDEAPPISGLIDAVYADGSVTVCTPCATRRGLVEEDFREETIMAGSARFVELLMAEGARAIVY